MNFLKDHLTEIIGAVVGLAASGAVFYFIRIQRKNSNNNHNKVTQKGNTIGGDVAGRDINKK